MGFIKKVKNKETILITHPVPLPLGEGDKEKLNVK
jgi:hypothetical protein